MSSDNRSLDSWNDLDNILPDFPTRSPIHLAMEAIKHSENISADYIAVMADAGANLTKAKIEACQLALDQWVEVRLNHNGTIYSIQPTDIISKAIKNH